VTAGTVISAADQGIAFFRLLFRSLRIETAGSGGPGSPAASGGIRSVAEHPSY
jgi:hypothetical protein